MYKQGELKGSPNCSPKITRQKGLSMRIFAPTYSEFDATAIETESPRGSTTRKSSIDGSAKSPEMMRTLKSSTGKFTVPDSDKVFKFKCSGEIGGDSLVAGKRVEWKAKFDRPIEELIYPSLQRFDIAGYEKKVQQRQQKTGLHEHHGSAKTPSMIKYFNNHESESQIKLEPIPAHLLPANEEIMYVYTPQWTVKLGDPVKTRSASEIFTSTGGSSSVGGGAASGGAPKYASITEEIDIAGEEYLRERMRASIAEREEEKKRKEKLAMSFLLGLNRRVAVGLDLQPVSLEPLDNAKNLYANLVKQSKDREEQDKKDSAAASSADESEISAFYRQKKIISDTIPQDQRHLLDGLLYYRHANENHNAQMAARRGTEQTHMDTFMHRDTVRRKSVNTFVNRLQKRTAVAPDSEEAKQTQILQMVREEDKVTQEKFTRVQRALDGRNVGMKQAHLKHAPAENIFNSSAASLRRSGVLFTNVADEKTYIEGQREVILAQNDVRHAQDTLLLQQLDKGVLPERFIKQGVHSDDPRHVSVILSKYGIGDTRGICLGKCLASIHHLDCLGLSDNRLTATSLPTIIENISYSTLLALDLSFNTMHETGIKALASYFKAKTVLQDLDLSNCGITCSDVKVLFTVLGMYGNKLEEIRFSCNSIAEDGANDICNFLISPNCHVDVLDLSWNIIGEKGAISFAAALLHNTSLSELNIASNSIGDNGGQRVIKSLKVHKRMAKFNVSQNDIADGSCFVAAQILKGHKTLQVFDLTFNPLGEAGARSLFRSILRGVTCWVFMGNCTFRENPAMFNCTYPSGGNPYTLDLSEPYKAAVLEELMIKFVENTVNCSFENVVYRETLKGGTEQSIQLAVQNKRVVLKNTGEVWVPPEKGFVKFMFQEVVAKPTMADVLDDV